MHLTRVISDLAIHTESVRALNSSIALPVIAGPDVLPSWIGDKTTLALSCLATGMCLHMQALAHLSECSRQTKRNADAH